MREHITDRYLNQTKYFCSQNVCFLSVNNDYHHLFHIEGIIHQSMSVVIRCNLNRKKKRKTKVRISKRTIDICQTKKKRMRAHTR